jgi:hypothetical protein
MLCGGPTMSFRDKDSVPVFVGDIVEKDGIKYQVQFILPYVMVTAVIVENLITHQVETLLLRDVKKI